jgi:hypothetical protein
VTSWRSVRQQNNSSLDRSITALAIRRALQPSVFAYHRALVETYMRARREHGAGTREGVDGDAFRLSKSRPMRTQIKP